MSGRRGWWPLTLHRRTARAADQALTDMLISDVIGLLSPTVFFALAAADSAKELGMAYPPAGHTFPKPSGGAR